MKTLIWIWTYPKRRITVRRRLRQLFPEEFCFDRYEIACNERSYGDPYVPWIERVINLFR